MMNQSNMVEIQEGYQKDGFLYSVFPVLLDGFHFADIRAYLNGRVVFITYGAEAIECSDLNAIANKMTQLKRTLDDHSEEVISG